ncbi:hypothetical protein VOLCADRAFT_97752 [Volvox carteri f. nagariensis]|uniref:Guanylate cyclase domain-containing protein n=1 Tax=Volvox carteri f. nagariensis TaxID=3068 RepID=D8UDJ7_VOLCA|nr:uncharacterized protein VOLCADRAFT_97752 [Volvox carteri f. nagariensis]EFJ42204.1 hypothetical protein VOLCADRAFT_97752 [Volvox carteri f. nagariensis]|eukprot:XP_002956747.1 hypothetical protein VOLCADRAFT_97752 [Volvox carteri f. nagariensis]
MDRSNRRALQQLEQTRPPGDEPATVVTMENKGQDKVLLGLVIALPVTLAAAALVLGFLLWRQCRRTRTLAGSVRPPGVGPQTTLLVTDIMVRCTREHWAMYDHYTAASLKLEGGRVLWRLYHVNVGVLITQNSTVLWESIPAFSMDKAVRLHHACLRKLLRPFNGYESATEGDCFILAFHAPADAARYALAAQLELMDQPWPLEVLNHPDACECPALLYLRFAKRVFEVHLAATCPRKCVYLCLSVGHVMPFACMFVISQWEFRRRIPRVSAPATAGSGMAVPPPSQTGSPVIDGSTAAAVHALPQLSRAMLHSLTASWRFPLRWGGSGGGALSSRTAADEATVQLVQRERMSVSTQPAMLRMSYCDGASGATPFAYGGSAHGNICTEMESSTRGLYVRMASAANDDRPLAPTRTRRQYRSIFATYSDSLHDAQSGNSPKLQLSQRQPFPGSTEGPPPAGIRLCARSEGVGGLSGMSSFESRRLFPAGGNNFTSGSRPSLDATPAGSRLGAVASTGALLGRSPLAASHDYHHKSIKPASTNSSLRIRRPVGYTLRSSSDAHIALPPLDGHLNEQSRVADSKITTADCNGGSNAAVTEAIGGGGGRGGGSEGTTAAAAAPEFSAVLRESDINGADGGRGTSCTCDADGSGNFGKILIAAVAAAEAASKSAGCEEHAPPKRDTAAAASLATATMVASPADSPVLKATSGAVCGLATGSRQQDEEHEDVGFLPLPPQQMQQQEHKQQRNQQEVSPRPPPPPLAAASGTAEAALDSVDTVDTLVVPRRPGQSAAVATGEATKSIYRGTTGPLNDNPKYDHVRQWMNNSRKAAAGVAVEAASTATIAAAGSVAAAVARLEAGRGGRGLVIGVRCSLVVGWLNADGGWIGGMGNRQKRFGVLYVGREGTSSLGGRRRQSMLEPDQALHMRRKTSVAMTAGVGCSAARKSSEAEVVDTVPLSGSITPQAAASYDGGLRRSVGLKPLDGRSEWASDRYENGNADLCNLVGALMPQNRFRISFSPLPVRTRGGGQRHSSLGSVGGGHGGGGGGGAGCPGQLRHYSLGGGGGGIPSCGPTVNPPVTGSGLRSPGNAVGGSSDGAGGPLYGDCEPLQRSSTVSNSDHLDLARYCTSGLWVTV